ncbi:MAG TPA: phytanoyl-CoA dioxygenase family protein [Pirellulales bacterium]|nr:phytanoyl-CoA dioxygenase family protein [Pirellulales bacterium]
MNPECLRQRLTPEEREFFNSRGYLIVENALDGEMNRRLLAAVDCIDSRERTVENRGKLLSVSNVVHEDPALVDLIAWPATLPKVWGILGWNIYLYHSHIDVSPPADAGALTWRVAWHQDSMRVNDEIESHPRPRLSLKIGYYLTDVSQSDRGNTLIVPGSHLRDQIDCPADGVSNPDGAEPLCVKPGSAVLIDRRIWHSRSPNLSDLTRKVVWYGYSYRWLRPKDAMTVEHLYPRLDPIGRQMLGDGLSANGVYDPVDGDVPLRSWLREHCPHDADWSHHGGAQSRPPAMVRGKNLGRQ